MVHQRLLQIHVAVLTSLAALLLGLGQRSAVMPLVVWLATMISFWLTDVAGYVRLNRLVANVANVAALVIALRGLVPFDRVSQILAIANMLVYLQLVQLFRKKDTAIYWHLIVLSILEVVAAALLSQGFWFGLLLVVYLFVGLGTLSLVFMHSERSRQSRLAAPTEVGLRPVFTAAPCGRVGINRELIGRLTGMGLATLALGLAVFLFVPRMGTGAWRGGFGAPRMGVGFSRNVELGELGRILENPEETMRIEFCDDETGEFYAVHNDLYLRGAILNQYEQGRWSFRPRSGPHAGYRLHSIEPARGEPLVRQRVTIEPMDTREVFCIWPFRRHLDPQRRDSRLGFHSETERLIRHGDAMGTRQAFNLQTPAMVRGVQAPLVPRDEAGDPEEGLLETPRNDRGEPVLPGLAALGRRWLADAKIPPENRYRRATFLERQFRDSGQFQYSLEGQSRDLEIDPIEDFVTKHPQGHCEYFATALAMMLRSQDIPARLIVGYHTDEWNRLGKFFQVRQLHAHAWVEAYLTAEQIPVDQRETRDLDQWTEGGWLRLDPTPIQPEEKESVWASATKSLNWFDAIWSNYVVEMDLPRQREAIYQPLLEWVRQLGANLSEPDWWRQQGRRLAVWLGLDRWGETATVWLGLICGLGLPAELMFLYVCYRIYRRSGAQWLERIVLAANPVRRAERASVAFYRRLETLLAQHGLTRPATKTPREFAREAGEELARRTQDAAVAAMPLLLADAYYQVRFGGVALAPSQIDAVKRSFEQLEAILLRKPPFPAERPS